MSSETDIPAFVGTGWSFPPEFLPVEHSTKLSDGREDIEESLRILLSTLPGERVMRPKYGCDLTPLLFEPLTTTLGSIMEDKVKTSLYYHEPRIEPISVRLTLAEAVEGRVLIEIDYRIRANNTRHNFVHPFDQQEGTEIQN